MTEEKFLKEVERLLPDIDIIGDFINSKTKILFRCKKCGYTHESTPYVLLRNIDNRQYGCTKCRPSKRLYTHEQFMSSIQDVLNPTIEIVGQYTGWQAKIQCHCKLCNNDVYIPASTLRQGCGCTKCQHEIGFQKRRTSQEDFRAKLDALSLNYDVLEPYKNTKTKLLCKCRVCGHEWKRYPRDILHRHDCPMCSNQENHNRQSLTTDDFIQKLRDINPRIKVVGEYYNNLTKIKCYCMDCNQYFDAIPRNLTHRKTCPLCTKSRGETLIKDWLTENHIPFIKEKTFPDLIGMGGGRLRYDFYIPDCSLLIEYNGIQHEKPADFGGQGKDIAIAQLAQQKQHDKLKCDYAKEHNLKLLTVWSKDIGNIADILGREIALRK